MKIVDLILKACVEAKSFASSGIRTAFMRAVSKGHLEIVQRLMSLYDFTQKTDPEEGPNDPLLVACERNQPAALEFLLQNGFNFMAGVHYFGLSMPENSYQKSIKEGSGKEKRELALRIMLESGRLAITSLVEFQAAVERDFGEPSIMLLILSHPGTNLGVADLEGARRLAVGRSYTDAVKFIDRLLASKREESPGSKSITETNGPAETDGPHQTDDPPEPKLGHELAYSIGHRLDEWDFPPNENLHDYDYNDLQQNHMFFPSP
ncbi:hypothetical protein CGLO_01328 [Colletotrichum gloeosporioides Cg-14]|uniref:Uncharacterized protein n=1 Tax=Colletotrichum gloeosporioides (strain Cg-14) TaxID=1237896 RepID=T0KS91_COLGC|nr:hypothetical protein CGLO_01328 [Colletotrichum gloeosporioides Cg-14]